MKLQHLRFFTAVVECGGVIKAAERLHISQPAVSTGLKALEDQLGGALFDRSVNRRLNLTPAGRRFYQHALEILQQCDEAKSDFVANGKSKLRVRIGLLDTLPQEALIRLMGRLAGRRPDWHVEIWEGPVQRLSAWLGQGRIDLAWTNVHGQLHGERPLWSEQLVAVVAPEHRFAAHQDRAVSIEELAGEPFLHRSRCELDALGRAQLRASGIILRVVARAERDDLAFELVRRNLGITLAPQTIVPADLVSVAVNGFAVTRSIGLQWLGGLEGDVIETIAEELADYVPRH